MTQSKILQKDAPILRRTAKAVLVKDIKSKKIRNILDKMKKALHREEDGVAIAAPQIGESLRIFLVSGKALALISKKKDGVEEGCLSVRLLYGQVKRSEKITIRAYNEDGKRIERGASGLLAQIFQHEIDHLDGILFIDKAEHVQDIPPTANIRFVFFGSLSADKTGSQFSRHVLNELSLMGLSPLLIINSAREPLPIEKLKEIDADVFEF